MALIESNPSDTGIRLLPKIMSPILTIIPNNTPVIKAKIFLIIFFGKYKKSPTKLVGLFLKYEIVYLISVVYTFPCHQNLCSFEEPYCSTAISKAEPNECISNTGN